MVRIAIAQGCGFPGGSAVAGPDGTWVVPPLRDQPGIVHAEFDLSATLAYKQEAVPDD